MTNQILKKVIKDLGKFNKKDIIHFLAVDIENVQPIDFTGQKYNKNTDDQTVFLFINEHYQIVGLTTGIGFNKKKHDYILSLTGPRNWKHFSENAEYILAFTPEMRNYSVKQKYEEPSNRAALKARLREYKIKKYNSISDEQILNQARDLFVYLASQILTDDPELIRKGHVACWYVDNYHSLIKGLSETIQEFKERVKEVREREEETKYVGEFYKERLNTARVDLLNWIKIFNVKEMEKAI